MVVSGIADGQVIALEWARSQCISGAVKPKTKCTSNREGKICMTMEAPCLKWDTQDGSVRNFRGGAGNGIRMGYPDGMSGFNQA